jgi:hypothetical protein
MYIIVMLKLIVIFTLLQFATDMPDAKKQHILCVASQDTLGHSKCIDPDYKKDQGAYSFGHYTVYEQDI